MGDYETGEGMNQTSDWGKDDPINRILQDAADSGKGPSNLRMVAREVAKLRDKLGRAEDLLAQLEAIPEHDPWGNGAVLRVAWRGYDYILLRAKGLWYSTGRAQAAPYRFTWRQLVDWLVKGGVVSVQELRPDRWLSIGDLQLPADQPTQESLIADGWCGRIDLHPLHYWSAPGATLTCQGTVAGACDVSARHTAHLWAVTEESAQRWRCPGSLPAPTKWCGDEIIHGRHNECGGTHEIICDDLVAASGSHDKHLYADPTSLAARYFCPGVV